MVEHKTRTEQLFKETKRGGPSPIDGNSPKGKLADTFKSIRNLFSKPWLRAGAKPEAQTQTVPALFSKIFSAQKLDLKSINQVLALVLAGLICLTGYFAFGERSDISSVTAAVSKIKFPDMEEKVITPFQDLAFYLDQVQTRDIFNEFKEPKPPPPVVKPVEPPPPPPPPKVTIQEKAKNLKLLGISWGADPKVIIKNGSTQEVLFLEEGQKIKGTDIRVKKILKDEVMISSEGDDMKLL